MARRRSNTPRSTTPRRRCTSATRWPARGPGRHRGQRVSLRPVSNLSLISDEDLRDPARNPWLKGRQLWLQIIVRGFWHPAGHLVDYYLAHSQPDRAVALASHAAATASYLDAPAPARGMALYNLACAQSRLGDLDQAAATIESAIGLNSDLRINASRDPDLQALRDSSRLTLLADAAG